MPDRRAPRYAGVACLDLVVAPLRILRIRPVLVSLALAAVILTATRLSDFWPAATIVALAISYFYGAHASLPGGAVAIAVLVVAMQVGMGFSEFPNVEIGFVTLIPFWLGYQVRLRSSLVSRLTERTRELREEHEAFARLSVRRERARIARELHDIVAHHLAVMVVQAGAGRIAGPGASQRASERFATIRQSGGQALAEMGRLVDLLHAEDPHGHDSTARWQLLVDDARAGGLTVQITSLSSKVQLPGALTDHAYQIVREGLTNAIKHAPGAHVTVHLAQRDAQLQIEVHDDGSRTGVSLAETGAGLGLMGMRERIESTGGTIVAGPDCDGGWCLRAALPLDSPGVVSTR